MAPFGQRPRQGDPVFMEELNRKGEVLRVSYHADDQVYIRLYGTTPKETFKYVWLDTDRFYGNKNTRGVWVLPSEEPTFEPDDRDSTQIVFDFVALDKHYSVVDEQPIIFVGWEKLEYLEKLSKYLKHKDDPRWGYLEGLRQQLEDDNVEMDRSFGHRTFDVLFNTARRHK